MKQTIKIPASDIKQFKKNSSFVKQNGIIPILNYIKFNNGSISKNNTKEFVIQQSNFNGTFLVEEYVLFNFIEYSNGTEITFTINDKKVTISDGITEVTSQSDNPNLFTDPELPTGDKIEIPSEVLCAIQTAAQYTIQEEFNIIKPYVHVGKKAVAASDGLIGFIQKFDFDLPEIALSVKESEKIGNLKAVKFSETERFHFFESGNSTYGFLKPEAKFIDLVRYFDYPKDVSFRVNKNDLLNYNDTCISVSPSKVVYPIFEITDSGLSLSMVDVDYNINVKRVVTASGTMNGRFKYIASLMSKLLKTAPDDEITFYQADKRFYITGDSGFTSLVMEIVL